MHGAFQTDKPLILASTSPRRRDFFRDLGLDCTLRAADVDETPRPGELPEPFVLRLAEAKARAVADLEPTSWVVAADTVVDVAGDILGKPVDEAEAMAMLRRLNGQWHEVWTGFCIGRAQDNVWDLRAVKTAVKFAAFSDEVLAAYLATGEPLDKAGAYGIQGRGGFLVERIDGSWSNVVGLPLAEVVAELLRLGVVSPLAG